jgi:membrane protein required for colicin V production
MIDLIFAVLMILAIVKGYRKGFIIALFSILAFIAGLAAAIKLSATVAVYLEHSTSVSSKWLPIISFVLVFLLVVLLVQLGAKLIEKTFELALLGWLNRLFGILLYMILYTLIFSVFLFYAEKMHLFDPATISASTTYPFVQPLGPKVINSIGQLIPIFKGMFTQLESFFEGISHKISH